VRVLFCFFSSSVVVTKNPRNHSFYFM
jgi:hypothetical protein